MKGYQTNAEMDVVAIYVGQLGLHTVSWSVLCKLVITTTTTTTTTKTSPCVTVFCDVSVTLAIITDYDQSTTHVKVDATLCGQFSKGINFGMGINYQNAKLAPVNVRSNNGRHVKRAREWHQCAKQTIVYSPHLVSRSPAHIALWWMASATSENRLRNAEVPTPVVPSADQYGAHLCLLYMQTVQLSRPGRILFWAAFHP